MKFAEWRCITWNTGTRGGRCMEERHVAIAKPNLKQILQNRLQSCNIMQQFAYNRPIMYNDSKSKLERKYIRYTQPAVCQLSTLASFKNGLSSANHLYPFLATLNFAKGHKGGRLCAVKGMWLRFLSFQSSELSGNSSERWWKVWVSLPSSTYVCILYLWI